MAAAWRVAHLRGSGIAEHAEPEMLRDRKALRAPLRVRRLLEPARDPRVHDQHANGGGQRDVLHLECAAIEDDRVIGAAVHRRHRVLDAARDTGRVLGVLGGHCELVARERELCDVAQRDRGRDRERGTRRKARADRYRRRDLE